MLLKWFFLLHIVFLLPMYSQELTDPEAKVAAVSIISTFTTWPTYKCGELRVGFVGSPSKYFMDAIGSRSKKYPVKWIPLRWSEVDAAKIDVLYVCDDIFFPQVVPPGVLTISDAPLFAERGGMVHIFLNEHQHLRLSINLRVVLKSGLKIDSKVLKLAKIVEI